MQVGLFTEFSYPGKSEQQTYTEVLEQIAVADALGFHFFSTTESYGRDLFSCSPLPLGLFVAAAQTARRIRFLTGIISMPVHHPAILASELAAADLLTGGRIMVGIGRGHPWVLNRVGIHPAESTDRFEEGMRMLIEAFTAHHIDETAGAFWTIRDFQLSPEPVQKPHPPIYTAAATTPESARFAGSIGHGLVQPGYLGIPFELVKNLTETYRTNLPSGVAGDVILGIHLHVAQDRDEAIESGSLALATQAEVFLSSSQKRATLPGIQQAYATKSASRLAFEKLCTPAQARQVIAAEGPNIMAVWGTPANCIEQIKFYTDALHPEQLMINIASGSLPQEKVLASMRLFASDVLPVVREL